MFGIKIVPVVDLNLVTEAGEQVFPIIGYMVVESEPCSLVRVRKRWNVNGKVGDG